MPSGAAKARAQAARAHLSTCAATALYYNCHLAPYGQASTDPMARFMTWNLPHALLPIVNAAEYNPQNTTFLRTIAYPLLSGVMDWYVCYLENSSGVWQDNNFFNPDFEHEGQPVNNPTIALALIQRIATATVSVAAALGITPPPAFASIATQLVPVSTQLVPGPSGPRNWTVWQDNRCSNVAASWTFYSVPDLAACQRHCDATATCALISYCPPVAVNNATGCSGANGEPAPFTCWGMPASQLPHCKTDPSANRGWTSALAASNATNNASMVPAWATYQGQGGVEQGDWFASYPSWPSESCDPASPWTPQLSALARATASLYGSDFGARGVDIAAQAVHAGARSAASQGPLDGFTPAEVAQGLEAFLARALGRNQLVYAPGGGIENTGLARVVCDMLLQAYRVDEAGQRAGAGPLGAYVLALFPFWPSGEGSSFQGLRAKGGFQVDAAYDGAAVHAVSVTALGVVEGAQSATACLRSPWGNSTPVAVLCGGAPAPVTEFAFSIKCWQAPAQLPCLVAPSA